MRRLLLMLLLTATCWAGEANVQTPVNAAASNNALTVGPFAGNVTSGNLIAVFSSSEASQVCPEVSSITDSLGTAYATTSICVNDATNAVQGEIWYGIATSTGADTLTVNYNHTLTHRTIAHEFSSGSGFAVSPVDQGVCGSGASGTPPASGNFITVGSDDVVFAGELDRGGGTHAAGTNWTLSSTAGGRYRSEYQLDKAGATFTADWATNALGAWVSCGVGFKAAAAAGGTTKAGPSTSSGPTTTQ